MTFVVVVKKDMWIKEVMDSQTLDSTWLKRILVTNPDYL